MGFGAYDHSLIGVSRFDLLGHEVEPVHPAPHDDESLRPAHGLEAIGTDQHRVGGPH